MPEGPVRELRLALTVERYDEVEVGSRVAGPVRVALEVADSADLARRLAAGGAEPLADRSSPPGATATSGSAPPTGCS
jgi:lactoylglutathione lyase